MKLTMQRVFVRKVLMLSREFLTWKPPFLSKLATCKIDYLSIASCPCYVRWC